MNELTLVNNEFLRQFEIEIEQKLARIEYSEQERKIFLTKLSIPKEIQNQKFEEAFIIKVLEFIENKKLYNHCKQQAKQSVEKFSDDIISKSWLNLLK